MNWLRSKLRRWLGIVDLGTSIDHANDNIAAGNGARYSLEQSWEQSWKSNNNAHENFMLLIDELRKAISEHASLIYETEKTLTARIEALEKQVADLQLTQDRQQDVRPIRPRNATEFRRMMQRQMEEDLAIPPAM